MSNQNLNNKIAIPYAEALLSFAKEKDLIGEITQDLSSISVVLSESKDLQNFFFNPLVSNLLKRDTIKQLFKNQVNDFILNFLLILVDRRRISSLSIIIDKYLQLVYELKSISIAELSSAIDLNDLQQETLVQQIKLLTKTNEVKLLVNKNPDLIGGFIIKIGSKIIDASLLGKLNRISLYLSAS
uniref:ATP synthase subunit delta, chloroplastic n=1 Tax=Chondria tumulosa TaxID=2740715 RepID=A0A896SQI8_9FLOR|nr:ATP synthase CF1 subunit delta [Chondria tumulosa]QSD57096.1 ATP synthase CF1 subunit delta [Chondria tumulosa]